MAFHEAVVHRRLKGVKNALFGESARRSDVQTTLVLNLRGEPGHSGRDELW
jgi:hypothetical protein